MKHVRVSLEDVEQATKRLDATKKHIESCAQRVIKNDLENTRYENERRKSMKEFKAREKDLKNMKNKLHRQTMEPKQYLFEYDSTKMICNLIGSSSSPSTSFAYQSGERWNAFEDDNLKDAFEELLRTKATQYGRSPLGIKMRIRDKLFDETEAKSTDELRSKIVKKADEVEVNRYLIFKMI